MTDYGMADAGTAYGGQPGGMAPPAPGGDVGGAPTRTEEVSQGCCLLGRVGGMGWISAAVAPGADGGRRWWQSLRANPSMPQAMG